MFLLVFSFASSDKALAVGDSSQYVSKISPVIFNPGQFYAITIVFKNNGTNTWLPGLYYLGSVNPVNNMNWGLNRVGLTNIVPPGANATFNFTVRATTTPGLYNFQWRLLQAGVSFFGATTPNLTFAVNQSVVTTAPGSSGGTSGTGVGGIPGVGGIIGSLTGGSGGSAGGGGGGGLNFGGVMVPHPEICTCSPGTYVTVGPPKGGTFIAYGKFCTGWSLGLYSPGGSCMHWAGKTCYPVIAQGTITLIGCGN